MAKTMHQIAQEAKIVRILFGVQLGHREVAAAMGLSRSGAQKYMNRMHEERMIHISGYCNPVTGGFPRPLFSAGRKPDAVYEPDRIKKPKRSVKQSDVTRARVLVALSKPASGKEVARAAFVSYEQAMKYIKELLEEKQVYIDGWSKAPGRGPWAAMYARGDKLDVPQPKRETRRERYEKERASEEYVKRFNQRRAHARLIDSLKKTPVSPFAALGV